MDQTQHARPDEDPCQQLAEDRRLAEALHPLAGQLRREPDDNEPEKEVGEFHVLSLIQRVAFNLIGTQAPATVWIRWGSRVW